MAEQPPKPKLVVKQPTREVRITRDGMVIATQAAARKAAPAKKARAKTARAKKAAR